ncbi:hypothetical protein AAG565_13440 [Fontimonas sp. SYSU GA230001]|uniref:hypothetical protein n=1 Tax=Fontimonas sp. SYSU GA230001 TaxID=3142450 RepID=UPI0032B49569
MNRFCRGLGFLPWLLLAACGGGGGDGGAPQPDALQPTLESIQAQVFTPRCATSGCHRGSAARESLRLDDAQTSYDQLVEVRSVQVPSRFRVEAGSPDTSYLIDKLEGTQAAGNRMPDGQAPLSAETVAVIRQWIADGAPR